MPTDNQFTEGIKNFIVLISGIYRDPGRKGSIHKSAPTNICASN